MGVGGVRVLERAMDILEYMADAEAPVRISSVAEGTGLSPATVYRILSAFRERNVVVQGADSLYRIGPTTLLWAGSYRPKAVLEQLFQRHVPALWELSRETVHLFSFEHDRLYYLDKLDSPQSVIMRSRIGAWCDLYCTGGGRAVLAALLPHERRSYLARVPLAPHTPRTTTDPAALLRLLDEGRLRGWQEETEENEPGIRCVGAAILDASNVPVGAISVSAPSYRMDDARSCVIGKAVCDTAAKMTADLQKR